MPMDPRLNSLTLKKLLRALADLLMPRVCVVCGRQLLDCEQDLCVGCRSELPLTLFWDLPRNPMGDRFNALVEAPAYVRAAALFYYSGDYSNITRALKYGRNFGCGRRMARQLGENLAAAGWAPELVCCVPLHWMRRWKRGYNQAEIIAREVAAALGVRFEPRVLRRVHRTASQTRLSASERLANVSNAFAVRPEAVAAAKVSGGILLIDDVFTTGATLAACYSALHQAFGDSVPICIATLAYAG